MADQIFDGVFGSVEQDFSRELAEKRPDFIFLDELLGLFVAVEGLLLVHCSYIKL